MRSIKAVAVLIGCAVLLMADPAGAQNARMSVSPTTVAAGGTVKVASVDKCVAPPNTPGGSPFVRVSIDRNRQTLGSGRAPVAADGSWSLSVRVSSSARAGSARVSAFCFFSEQAEGALEAYAQVDIQVRGRAASSGATLARTGPGAGTRGMAVAGFGLVELGALLAVAGRRRRTAPAR
ncbi:MAG TPA: hypothetical protein VGO92_02875 [Acidimicrobiales bacterium]|nr:hypothetical protein [Acidimicrobiales bacterium]